MIKLQTVLAQFKLTVLSINGVPDSFSSEVYKLELSNHELVYAKIPYSKDKLYREYKILKMLEGVVPVPKVLDFWAGDEENTGALLLSAVPGNPCQGQIDEKLAFDIGVIHAKLHEVKMSGYGYDEQDGFHFLENNDWRLYIKRTFGNCIDSCKELLDTELFNKCIVHFERVFKELPPPDGPCLVHMDLRPANILVNENDVTGFIDFESSRGGSSEIDFSKVNRDIWEKHPKTRDAYVKGYETIRPMLDLDKILPFYSFYDAFGSVAWCKRRGIEKNKDFLTNSIAILRKLVD